MTVSFILCLLGAYLLGSIPTGLILSKLLCGQDIRSQGSGNIGATNVARVLGLKYGMLTLLADMLKGFISAWCGLALFHSTTYGCLLGAAAFFGHIFSAYLRFRGGKGVATAFGVMLCLAPSASLVVLALFLSAYIITGYVAVGSLLSASLMPVILFFLSFPLPVFFLSILMGLGIVIRHRNNINRLKHGQENRIRVGTYVLRKKPPPLI